MDKTPAINAARSSTNPVSPPPTSPPTARCAASMMQAACWFMTNSGKEKVHIYWVHDFNTEEWLDATKATFVHSPE
ncbi:MAG: hypothetical protein M5U34_15875 [Chloroflexi bacterium]|nr:hypothetical protein [Chloroflexota bacterium]